MTKRKKTYIKNFTVVIYRTALKIRKQTHPAPMNRWKGWVCSMCYEGLSLDNLQHSRTLVAHTPYDVHARWQCLEG